jgi:hypothetical protein
MSHVNTVLNQMLNIISRHEFETLANQYHSGRKFRTASRWSQFVTMVVAQVSGRQSLRDVIDNLGAQAHRLYHLGCALLSRSNLGRINENKSYELYEALFGKLLSRCQGMPRSHDFRFHNSLYSLDASTIDLCLQSFPWADFRTTKGAVKLHVGLDHSGLLPSFISITDGKKTDIEVARTLKFPKGSIVVCDRGYNDYQWYNQLSEKGVYFVTRLKSNAKYRVTERREVNRQQGLKSDQTIEFTGTQTKKRCDIPLRRVSYRDPETGQHYVFLTNHCSLSAKTIADIYKQRWQIELFFKWIKQNLKIKTFMGTSKNAVLTQIWIAMCVYLMLAFIRFQSKLGKSMQQILRILQLNLFEKRDLMALLRGDPPRERVLNPDQMLLSL